MAKGKIVSIANQRVQDLPRSCQLPTIEPFRKRANERHAGVTGKIRREMAPFLWYSVMGIPQSINPDDDPFVQLLLMIDFLQRKLLGINQKPEVASKTREDISDTARLGYEVGKKAATVLNCAVNTKLHRTMRHISDHYLDFGCFRKGATDGNETLHKATKLAYRSTNKQLSKIAPQLLSARAIIETKKHDAHGSQSRSQLLLTRRPVVLSNKNMPEPCTAQEAAESVIPEGHVDRFVLLLEQDIEDTDSSEDAEKAITRSLQPSTNLAIYRVAKSIRFLATVPWCLEQSFSQTIYAGYNVFGYARQDAIQYKKDGGQIHFGVVQAIFSHAATAKSRIALVRRLEATTPDNGNVKVVLEFGNERLKYVQYKGDVKLDCVLPSSLFRPAMLIPDPWVVSKLYGLQRRMNDLPDTPTTRKNMRFFEVAGFKYTSLPEQVCV
ncbi:unnamed protein product [Chondrus crispus]|uniref:Uncharacterized protein n=1 Tax=Chondrus crispus TaxID=2769 RepID=R7QIT9_CHOCR|nr:unnamed protein product [Chondrus crispus]CDF37391.1 unnamed protein product [Chondrus crispus]|eukprot:XP_005717210.1 unnamed protein product [Chondrus crispus]